MSRARRVVAAAQLLLLIVTAAGIWQLAATARQARAGTAPGIRVITGKLVVRDPGSDRGNQLLVEDKNGAPMWWVNMFGEQSGGEPVCAMDLRLQPVVCLGGRFGQYGTTPVIVFYSRGRVIRVLR